MPTKNKKVACICETCGKEFTVKPSHAKNRRYCSWECKKISGNSTKETFICQYCGKEFVAYKKYSPKYCSISCGISARNKTEQNPAYHRDISGDKNPMHGRGLYGKENPMFGKFKNDNPAWNGGRKIRRDGYVLVIAPQNHPYPISNGKDSGTKYILEHRLVMEMHIGRYLDPNEVIHHIDGDPSNNSIDNLRLYSTQAEHIRDAHGG